MAAATLAVPQTSSAVLAQPAGAPVAPPAAALTQFPGGANALTSLNTSGQASKRAQFPLISGNGRWQVFDTLDTMDPAAAAPTPPAQVNRVYVRDLVKHVTHLISVGSSNIPVPSAGPLPTAPTVPDNSVPPDGTSQEGSISADGRYVSFVTSATNIVPTLDHGANGSRSVVVCDRGVPTPAGDFTAPWPIACYDVYSGPGFGTGSGTPAGAVSGAPRLSAHGNRIVWSQASDANVEDAYYSDVSTGAGPQTPTTPQIVPVLATEPASCVPPPPIGFAAPAGKALNAGAAAAVAAAAVTIQPSAIDPVPDKDGTTIAFISQWRGNTSCEAVFKTTFSTTGGATTTVRVDKTPGTNQSTYLGDLLQSTTQTVAFNHLTITDDGFYVMFNYQFADPTTPALDKQQEMLAYFTDTEVISRDYGDVNNLDGAPVAGFDGTISGDGRFVAFTTNAPNTYRGVYEAGNSPQIVVRDRDVDIDRRRNGDQRAPGQLATPDTNPQCNPPAGQACGAKGFHSELSMDTSGARLSFTSGSTNLDPTVEGTGRGQSYVHAWLPQVSTRDTDLGDVQVGASAVASVPVQITGFGPVVFGSTLITGDTTEFHPEASGCNGATLYDDQFRFDCVVSVRFAPTSLGDGKTASVHVNAAQYLVPNDATSPTSVPVVATVTGNGVATGPVSAPADNTRVSLTPSGGQGSRHSGDSQVSGNGRWVVFASRADLTGRQVGDQVEWNVFARDLADPQTTVQLSLHSANVNNPKVASTPAPVPGRQRGVSPDGNSEAPSISSDGRFVTFRTNAADVTSPLEKSPTGSPPNYTWVVCDRDPNSNGVFDEVRSGLPELACFPLESGSFGDQGPNADAVQRATISGDGTTVAWVELRNGTNTRSRQIQISTVSSLGGPLHAPNAPRSVFSDIPGFVNNLAQQTEQMTPVLSEDGKTVVYWADVRPDPPGSGDLALIRARLTADPTAIDDARIDVTPPGTRAPWVGDNGATLFGDPEPPAVTDDATKVAFSFVQDGVRPWRLYVTTRQPNGTWISSIESRTNNDREAAGSTPAISGDGRYLAFIARDANMHNGVDAAGSCTDGNTTTSVTCQVVARDLTNDSIRTSAGLPRLPAELVSYSIDPQTPPRTGVTACQPTLPPGRFCASDDSAQRVSIDATGSEVAFDTSANDIVPGDTNLDQVGESGLGPAEDVFVHTWRPTVNPSSVAFGALRVGQSVTKQIKLTLSNFGPASLGASSLTGPNPGDYVIAADGCNGTTLHDYTNDSCIVTVTFKPTVAGVRSATLSTRIAKNSYPRHNADNSRVYDPVMRTLTGNASIPLLRTNPTSLDFGAPLPEFGVTKTVKITNSGSAPLKLGAITVADTTHPGAKGDYAVDRSNCPAILAVGRSCIVKVTFKGSKVGIRDAVLLIPNNSFSGTRKIPLKARINKPTVQSNPAVSPIRRVITITGTGFAPGVEVEVGFNGNKQATMIAKGNGTFVLQMVVLPNGPQGPRLLFGRSSGLDPSIADDYPFLVALGSTDPGLVVKRDG